MNYIELINNFWKIDHDFKFSSLETALYFRLLSKANSTCWQEEFVYTNARLMEDLDCSVSKLRHARDRLLKAGLFAYVSGNKSTPGKYSLLSQHNRNTATTESRQNHDTNADNPKSFSLEDLREDRPTVLATIAAQSQHNDDTIEAQKQQIIINKTKLNKTKQENILSPDGETKTLFSNPRGEGTEDCPLRIEIFEVERETAFHSVSMDKSIEPFASETSSDHEALPSGEEKTFPVGKGEGEFSVRQDQREIVGISAIEQTEEEALGCVECNSCSKFERDVMETWEVLIGPFESHWIPLLRETLTKCYPSQVKNAIIAIDRSKHEVLMERGFEYIVQPLLNGTFGRRVKKNGRNDWHGSGSFRDPIEKFKNPAKEKPKTREELLKYTQY